MPCGIGKNMKRLNECDARNIETAEKEIGLITDLIDDTDFAIGNAAGNGMTDFDILDEVTLFISLSAEMKTAA